MYQKYFNRIILIIFLFIFITTNVYSYKNVSSCSTIDAAFMGAETEVRMNTSISNSASTCFTLSQSNITFDCRGNTIDGTSAGGSIGISIPWGTNNISVKNCIINEFNDGLKAEILYFNLSDSNFSNNAQSGIWVTNSISSSYKNLILKNSLAGVIVIGSQNTTFQNLVITNNTDGFYLAFAMNHRIFNSNISENINNNIYFGSGGCVSNVFYNNYLGNHSKISSVNWTVTAPNYFNLSSVGNTYLGNVTPPLCFDSPTNLVCDSYASEQGAAAPESQENSISSSSFPYNGIFSQTLTILIIIIHFII